MQSALIRNYVVVTFSSLFICSPLFYSLCTAPFYLALGIIFSSILTSIEKHIPKEYIERIQVFVFTLYKDVDFSTFRLRRGSVVQSDVQTQDVQAQGIATQDVQTQGIATQDVQAQGIETQDVQTQNEQTQGDKQDVQDVDKQDTEQHE